jgi:hypothetical protein
MGGVRMAVYAVFILAALVLADWRVLVSEGSGLQDARLVYCLQPGHQGALVNAAISLGLATPGSTPIELLVDGRRLTLTHWRSADDAAFNRSCNALATTALPAEPGNADSGTAEILAILLPVIAGSLLTMAADDFKNVSDRRWAQADELRADWKAFDQAVLSYAQLRREVRPGGIPPSSQIDENRRNLASSLRKIHAQHRKSPTIESLQETLAKGDLGPSITAGWPSDDEQDSLTKRNDRVKQITGYLETASSSIEKIASALERRVWLSSKL